MKYTGFIILALAGLIIGGMIGYMISSSKQVPKFSEMVSVKTLDGARRYSFIYSKIFWDITTKTVCQGTCIDYDSSSW
jgi:hypothetical protein